MRYLVVLAVALAMTACSAGHSSATTTVDVSVSACGHGWTGGVAGQQHFVLRDTDSRAGEVSLVDAHTGAVYAEVDQLGPGASADVHADLGAGSYAFRCAMEDEAVVTGAAVRLTGNAHGDTPAVAAVSQGDLIAATKQYQSYVEAKLPGLQRAVAELRADVVANRLGAARRDWLPAHLDYIRLGAAYGAFGDADTDLNGLPDGLPHGVQDASWHGFHRLEYGLWQGASVRAVRPVADRLVADVAKLRKQFPSVQVDPLDIGIRAHEITEDAVRFALSGRDDYGSHSDLATVRADVDGTRAVLDAVRSVLAPRYHAIGTVDAQLSTTAHDIDALRDNDGSLPGLSALTRPDRERVNADVSQLAEELAPVAAILEPRKTQ